MVFEFCIHVYIRTKGLRAYSNNRIAIMKCLCRAMWSAQLDRGSACMTSTQGDL